MNVVISKRDSKDVIARYEIHLAEEGKAPEDRDYFDAAWRKAVGEGLVDAKHRDRYAFQLQRPKTLYESSV